MEIELQITQELSFLDRHKMLLFFKIVTYNYLEHASCHIYYSIDIPDLCLVVNLNRLKASDKTGNTFTG